MNRRTLVGRFFSGLFFGLILFAILRWFGHMEEDLSIRAAYGGGLLFAVFGWPVVRYALIALELYSWFSPKG